MTCGEMIKRCRKEKGFTQAELAELIGVSVQAISKWETDSGMPGIHQLVPLSKVLEVSTDMLLGVDNTGQDAELLRLREAIGEHDISFGRAEAKRVYDLAKPYFDLHPTCSEAAFWCLESVTDLIAQKGIDKSKGRLLLECERYANCIFRYETISDEICRTYYVLARAYKLLGEAEKAAEVSDKLPVQFGDKTYWEAEFAFADGDYETALLKCKQSFAVKARFIARCIRMAAYVNDKTDGSLEDKISLNEYMLRILDAFLSGGDFMPYRQVYQKSSLLCGLTSQYAALGEKEKAKQCVEELQKLKEQFLFQQTHRTETKNVMFLKEDMDGSWKISEKQIEDYLKIAKEWI